jgi:hypothetical protein
MAEARPPSGTGLSPERLGGEPAGGPEGRVSEGPEAVRLGPWLGAFGGAGLIWLAARVSLWAYDQELLGPRRLGQRLLLGGPLAALRAVQGVALAVAAYSGAILLTDLRRRWRAYTERVRQQALF